jgi:TonB family protein
MLQSFLKPPTAMSSPNPTHEFFLEQTDFSLRFARCSGPAGARCVEAIREVLISDAHALEEGLQAVFQHTTEPVVLALRTKPQLVHLATPAEARTHPGLLGVRQLAAQYAQAGQPAWLAATQSRNGAAPADTPWLATYATAEDRAEADSMAQTLHLTPGRRVSSLHLTAGALTESVKEPALLIEIGVHRSRVFFIGRAGVMASGQVSLGIEQIAEAVQSVLNLKYRGSAQKLFLNEQYDFTESAAAIVERLVPALQGELVALAKPAGQTPVTLHCSGLPARQQWFASHLAAALQLKSFAPDYDRWCKAAGLSFAAPLAPVDIPPLWLGFMHLLGTHASPAPEWQAEWQAVAEAKVAAPARAANAPLPPAAHATPATPVKSSRSTPPMVTPSAPVRHEPVTVNAATLEAPPEPVEAAVRSAVIKPAAMVVTAATTPVAEPVVAVPPTPPVSAGVESIRRDDPPRRPSLFLRPAVLAAVFLLLAIAGGGYFYVQNQRAEEARLAAERTRHEQRLREESERARVAEQKARDEAEARKQFEFSLNQKLAATEAAREQAESEARAQAAARLANARGRLVVTTEPAGALVTVGLLPPRPSPATFEDVRIGEYPVAVALAGYDSAELKATVRENETTELPAVALVRVTGTLELTTQPSGLTYELKPAGMLFVTDPRTGRTPATLGDLTPGSYVVTFTQAGWSPHSETVAVTRDGTTRAAWTLPKGTVRIASAPAGVSVYQNGKRLGLTPLTIPDTAPGDLRFELSAEGLQGVSVQGRLEENGTLDLRGVLLTTDGVIPSSEIESNPVPLTRVQPDLSDRLKDVTGSADIEMTIDRDGLVKAARVARTTHVEFGKACAAAALKWKFKPALVKGQPVKVRVSVPFSIVP